MFASASSTCSAICPSAVPNKRHFNKTVLECSVFCKAGSTCELNMGKHSRGGPGKRNNCLFFHRIEHPMAVPNEFGINIVLGGKRACWRFPVLIGNCAFFKRFSMCFIAGRYSCRGRSEEH